MGVVGVETGVATGPPLAEQVPALVQLHAEGMQAIPVGLADVTDVTPFEGVLLVDQGVYAGDQFGVIHCPAFYRARGGEPPGGDGNPGMLRQEGG